MAAILLDKALLVLLGCFYKFVLVVVSISLY